MFYGSGILGSLGRPYPSCCQPNGQCGGSGLPVVEGEPTPTDLGCKPYEFFKAMAVSTERYSVTVTRTPDVDKSCDYRLPDRDAAIEMK